MVHFSLRKQEIYDRHNLVKSLRRAGIKSPLPTEEEQLMAINFFEENYFGAEAREKVKAYQEETGINYHPNNLH